jgi:hypothetical protein
MCGCYLNYVWILCHSCLITYRTCFIWQEWCQCVRNHYESILLLQGESRREWNVTLVMYNINILLRTALKLFNIHPTVENLITFKSVKARHVMFGAKRSSWETFIPSLSCVAVLVLSGKIMPNVRWIQLHFYTWHITRR